MRITALLENTTHRADMQVEHGLSLYIETASHRILFDMGQTALFAENAKRLGIDLTAVDLAVLSHGHYDHGGGLETFLQINQTAPVYVSRDAFLPHYNGTEKYIGLSPALATHPRLIVATDGHPIDGGLTLFSCNDRRRRYPLDSGGLTEKTPDGFVADDFRHEQYLLIEEAEKRVLISGCSHKGIRDITEWFAPDVLVGGFHFSKLPLDATLRGYAEQLGQTKTEFYTCHCTGEAVFAFMQPSMPRAHYLSCGQTVTI